MRWPAGFYSSATLRPAEQPFDCLNGSNFMQPLCCQSYVFGEHHECAATCLDLLSDCAGTVNSLGEVQWCSVETILRSTTFLGRRIHTLAALSCACQRACHQ